MLLARSSLFAATALRRGPVAAASPVVATSIARSFSTSHVVRLSPSFFQSSAPTKGISPSSAPRSSDNSSSSNSKDHGQHETGGNPQPRRRIWTYARYGLLSPSFTEKHPWLAALARLGLSVVVGSTLLIGVILIHDAFTYSQRHLDRVPVNPLALKPRRGGPKNLPIIDVELDDLESAEKVRCEKLPRLVIVGGGWGVSLRLLLWGVN